MKYKIIKTDNYLLIVDDSEIKESNIVLYKNQPCIFTQQIDANGVRLFKYLNSGGIGMGEDWGGQKIIAHLPLNDSPILEGVDLLPPLEDEVVKLAVQEVGIDNSIYNISDHESFIKGYNKAKEKYEYTEKDLKKAIEISKDIKYVTFSIDEIIQSLQQPKYPVAFECEMVGFEVDMGLGDDCINYGQYRKTIINSQGKAVLGGTYIY